MVSKLYPAELHLNKANTFSTEASFSDLRLSISNAIISMMGLTVGFLLLQYSITNLYVLLSPYLCFISFLYLNLYVIGDNTSMGKGSYIRTKHIFAFIHIRNNGGVGAIKHV